MRKASNTLIRDGDIGKGWCLLVVLALGGVLAAARLGTRGYVRPSSVVREMPMLAIAAALDQYATSNAGTYPVSKHGSDHALRELVEQGYLWEEELSAGGSQSLPQGASKQDAIEFLSNFVYIQGRTKGSSQPKRLLVFERSPAEYGTGNHGEYVRTGWSRAVVTVDCVVEILSEDDFWQSYGDDAKKALAELDGSPRPANDQQNGVGGGNEADKR